ncbi:MAG: YdcF family protein [Acidobacteria bacterium]|nr:YdcF family protein [Acidobacteriota bacterium]
MSRISKIAKTAGLSIAIIAIIWLPLAWFLGQWLVVEKPMEKADAILVLAGSANYVERNTEAARLYKMGVAPKILLTDDRLEGGWNNARQRNPYFVERARWLLMENGVPEEKIEILPDIVSGTDDEADALASYLEKDPLMSVLIITSAFHTRRAIWTFENTLTLRKITANLGMTAPTPPKGMPPDAFWWLSREGLKVTISEYMKHLYYFVRK